MTIFSPNSIDKIRKDFPILQKTFHDKPLIYLDSAVSNLMPKHVARRMYKYQSLEHTNVHRGVSTLSHEATQKFEEAREKVKKFINAPSSKQIIWTHGTTESINLIAQTYGKANINYGDEILLSTMEHHSNIIPWQILASERHANIKLIPINTKGDLVLDDLDQLLTNRTKIISITHMSNVLGTINPVKTIIEKAHAKGIPVVIDGAQSVAHIKVDVSDLDADFYTFSGHKLYGPTGIGVLYGRKELLETMPIWQSGGNMIKTVKWNETIFNDIPQKFEAGTPPIAQAIGIGTAIDYINDIGHNDIIQYENDLLKYATNRLQEINDLKIIGQANNKSSIISFIIDNIHPHDVGSILDYDGIVVRAGHHCAQPIMEYFNIPATTRISLSVFNTMKDIDTLVSSIHKVQEVFK